MHPTDAHVGQRIRQRRRLAGITQTELADAIGVKFQQVQKYETGTNRISASRLHDAAKLLDIPVAWFFEGLDAGAKNTLQAETHTEAELLRAMRQMEHVQRAALLNIARTMTRLRQVAS